MPANAGKSAPRTAPKKRTTRSRATTAKPTRSKPERRVARVSEGALGKLAVLANDPDFQKQIAEHIERGVLVQAFGRALREIFMSAKWAREPAVTEEAMRTAEEFLGEVARHNGPPPSEAELDEMIRSSA